MTVSDHAGTRRNPQRARGPAYVCVDAAGRQLGKSRIATLPRSIGDPMNTRTIAILALVIAVVLLIIFLV